MTGYSQWSTASYFLQCLVLWRCGTVVRVLLRAVHGVHVLPCTIADLLGLVRELLNVAICLARAESPYRAGQPLPQRVPGAFGAWGAVRTQGLAGAWL